MGIQERVAHLLRHAPEGAPAIEHDDAWWTWGAVRECARSAESLLTAAGAGPGTRVGIVMENRPEHVAALAALLADGRRAVLLNPLQPPARLADQMTRARLPVVFAGPEPLSRDGVLPAVRVHGTAAALESDGSLVRRGGTPPADGSGGAADAEDILGGLEMFTSGTTGPPKAIRLSLRQLDKALLSGNRPVPVQAPPSSSVSLVATPTVHIAGIWGVISALYTGRRLALLGRFAVEPWTDRVERYGVRAAFLVPAALRGLLDAEVPPRRLASLKLITTGGSACPAEVADLVFRRYGIRVLSTYGATEFVGAVAGWTYALHERWWRTKAGSAGRAYPGVELRVTGLGGGELPPGREGRLEVRTAQSGAGPGTWVRTTDLARIDADGFLWIAGRADDAILRGGFTVRPETVQQVLERHPAVREAAVVGLPDERLGAIPVAAVEVEAGVNPPTEAELITLCRNELTPYEMPLRLLPVAALPRGPAGKVDRPELLELLRADRIGDAPASAP